MLARTLGMSACLLGALLVVAGGALANACGQNECIEFVDTTWETWDCIDSYSCADSGNKFIVLDLTLENTGDETHRTGPSYLDLDSTDGVTRSYDSATYSLSRPLETAELRPGGSITGGVAFQIPNSAQPERVCVNFDWDDSYCIGFEVNEPPQANFRISSKDGLTVRTDASASSDPDGRIVSYEWQSSSYDSWEELGSRMKVEYNNGGRYTISLRVTDDSGATDIATRTVTVEPPPPTARFTSDVQGAEVRVDAGASSAPGGTIEEYEWTWGDGASSSGPTARHTYDEAGQFTIHLSVTDTRGRTDEAQEVIKIDSGVEAAFSVDPTHPSTEDRVEFQDESTIDIGEIEELRWSIPGQETTTGDRIEHTFDRPGTYDITLTAVDEFGAQDSVTESVEVTCGALLPLFSVDENGRSVSLDASESCTPEGRITSYRWSLGDDNNATGSAAQHTYETKGNYTVSLTIEDEEGETATQERVVLIDNTRPTPIMRLEGERFSTAEEIRLFHQSEDEEGTVVRTAWEISPGSGVDAERMRVEGNPASVSLPDDGTYTVTLKVEDDQGATSTAEETIFAVNQKPIVGIAEPDSVVAGEPIELHPDAQDRDGTISYYSWNYGDGNGTEGKVGTHTFARPGTYTVMLSVTDDDGASNSTSLNVTVDEPKDAPGAVLWIGLLAVSIGALVAARGQKTG